jgi:hypothetical protein
VTDNDDRYIAAWIRKAEALAERLMVPPAEVYETLIERGYTGDRVRNTVSVETAVAFIGSLFRPEEILPVYEVALRFENHPKRPTTPANLQRYVKQVLLRNCGERGKRRFRRVKHGAYRLQLSNPELRVAVLDELAAQRAFVGSRRLMELFDVSHERLLEVLGPLVGQNRVVSRPNSTTKNRDWCLLRYAEVFR